VVDQRQRSNPTSTHCARVEKEKKMKLVLRILPTVFVLISSIAFADTAGSGLIPQSFFSLMATQMHLPNSPGIPQNYNINNLFMFIYPLRE